MPRARQAPATTRETLLPNIKAAEKWVSQSEKRATRNRDVKTRLKTLFKKAKTAASDEGQRSTESQFDKAAQKGVIHPNKAARKKSRLTKAIRAEAAAAAAPAKPATRKRGAATKR